MNMQRSERPRLVFHPWAQRVLCVCVHFNVLSKGTLCRQCALVYSGSCTTRGQSEELCATSPCMCAPVGSLLAPSVQAHWTELEQLVTAHYWSTNLSRVPGYSRKRLPFKVKQFCASQRCLSPQWFHSKLSSGNRYSTDSVLMDLETAPHSEPCLSLWRSNRLISASNHRSEVSRAAQQRSCPQTTRFSWCVRVCVFVCAHCLVLGHPAFSSAFSFSCFGEAENKYYKAS